MSKINFSSERVNSVINAINSESTTLGAVIRNFVAVCECDDYARYMLDTITGMPQSFISMSVNSIKLAVIAKYPYKDKDNNLLRKDSGLFVPYGDKYTADIVKRAFYAAVGHTKPVDVVPATKAQINEHNAKKEAKKAESSRKAEAKKAAAANYEKFYTEIMNAAESDIIAIVRRYKAAAAGAEAAAANIVLG